MPDKNVFVIDDGTKEFEMQNTFGETICTIRIRPGEIGLIDRYNELMNDIGGILSPLETVTLNPAGEAEFQKDWEIVKGVENKLIEKINALFDFHDAESIFRTRSMFASINGEFFVEKVLEALGQLIRAGVEEEAKKASKRIDKYTKDLNKRQVNGRVGTTANNN